MTEDKVVEKIVKSFPLKVYYNKITEQIIGPLNQTNYLVIADRDKVLPPPINGLPEGVEVRFADLQVFSKEATEKEVEGSKAVEESKKQEEKKDGQESVS